MQVHGVMGPHGIPTRHTGGTNIFATWWTSRCMVQKVMVHDL